MLRDRTWGDNVALEAVANVLRRPIAIWRRGSLQNPTVMAPMRYDFAAPAEPIYLELDDIRKGNEHYSALVVADDGHGGGALKYVLGMDVQDVATCNVCGELIRGAVYAGDNGADVHFGCMRVVTGSSRSPSGERAHDKRRRRLEHQARWAAVRTPRRQRCVRAEMQSAAGHIVKDAASASPCQEPGAMPPTPLKPTATPVRAWLGRLLMVSVAGDTASWR